jgi:hypothetical protein
MNTYKQQVAELIELLQCISDDIDLSNKVMNLEGIKENSMNLRQMICTYLQNEDYKHEISCDV